MRNSVDMRALLTLSGVLGRGSRNSEAHRDCGQGGDVGGADSIHIVSSMARNSSPMR
ncbi:hypothetical protein THIOKS12790018 [Thiocapsa sp. KS1]|nr:hypothetical protein THIOKS12790018 [Thiocapsa sp. KS1]